MPERNGVARRVWTRLTAMALGLLFGASLCGAAAAVQLNAHEGEVVIQNFHFHSDETMQDLRLHYLVIGTPQHDAAGHVTNAVLILHGTGGSAAQFLNPDFAGRLFGPGQPLDANRYFIIIPDEIGHGRSSKPSDSLKASFPHYDYGDMVRAAHEQVTKGLKVDHLRLILGTSMGCMQAFLWGETYPGEVDALMPLACTPDPIAGRNRVWRAMILDAIRSDPAWNGGAYDREPAEGLRAAASIMWIAGSAPLQLQQAMPNADTADAVLDSYLTQTAAHLDANDVLYQYDASRDFDASADLDKITARVMWINTADDFINPPELGIAEREAGRLKRGRFVLLPIGKGTRGHGTHTYAPAWESYLVELLEEGS